METTTTTSVETTFSAATFNHIAALCKRNGIELSLNREYDVNNMPANIIEALLTVYDMMSAGKFTYKKNFRELDGSRTDSMKFRIRNIQIHDCCKRIYLWLRAVDSFNFNADLDVATVRRLLTGPMVFTATRNVTKECLVADESGFDTCNIVASNKPDTNK